MSTYFTCFGNYGCVNDEQAGASARSSILVADHNAGAERVRDQFQLAKLRVREIGAGVRHGLALSRYLEDADDFSGRQYWRAHDFLDGIAALLVRDGHRLKDGRVRNHREVIDQLRPLFAHGTRRQGIRARERNLANRSQAIRREKAQGASVRRESQDGDFMRLQAKILADQLQRANELNRLAVAAFSRDIGRPFLQFANMFAGHRPIAFPYAKPFTAYS